MTAPPPAPLAPEWAFVVRLRRGTSFAPAELSGRIEHVESGRACDVESLEQLRLFMRQVMAETAGTDDESTP